MKTLKEFLKKHNACEDGYLFAKDFTLEQFLNNCERGDWILWLFARSNPRNKKLRTLIAGHCANTVRHLMENERSKEAVDMAIKYGEGKATRKQLDDAYDAYAAAAAAYDAYAATIAAARKKNQKLTADICRKYLPIEIWNIK